MNSAQTRFLQPFRQKQIPASSRPSGRAQGKLLMKRVAERLFHESTILPEQDQELIENVVAAFS